MRPQPVPLTCTWSPARAPIAILVLEGELDYQSVDEFLLDVTQHIETNPALRELRIDCAGLVFCDSLGLSALLTVRRRTDAAGARLRLDNRPPALERMLRITGTLTHFTGELDRARTAGHPGDARPGLAG